MYSREKIHKTYRVRYYLWFPASSGGPGISPHRYGGAAESVLKGKNGIVPEQRDIARSRCHALDCGRLDWTQHKKEAYFYLQLS